MSTMSFDVSFAVLVYVPSLLRRALGAFAGSLDIALCKREIALVPSTLLQKHSQFSALARLISLVEAFPIFRKASQQLACSSEPLLASATRLSLRCSSFNF